VVVEFANKKYPPTHYDYNKADVQLRLFAAHYTHEPNLDVALNDK